MQLSNLSDSIILRDKRWLRSGRDRFGQYCREKSSQNFARLWNEASFKLYVHPIKLFIAWDLPTNFLYYISWLTQNPPIFYIP